MKGRSDTFLYYAIRFINILLFLLVLLIPLISYLWYTDFNPNREFYKNSVYRQKIELDGVGFFEMQGPQNQWLVRVYNVSEINSVGVDDEVIRLSPLHRQSVSASFDVDNKTVEIRAQSDIVHRLFNKILLYSITGIFILMLFIFFLRRILVAARLGMPFSASAISSFRWMALIVFIYCFIPKSDAEVVMGFVRNNFEFGHIRTVFNNRGINVNALLIIGSMTLLCLAEIFRNGLKLKEEQEFTI